MPSDRRQEAPRSLQRGPHREMVERDVILAEKGLFLPCAGAQPAYFNYFWLRDNCPSSWDPQTRERVFDIFGLAENPRPSRAWIEGDHLVIDWQGEGHVSRFGLDWLRDWASSPGRPDRAALPRRPWFSDHDKKLVRFSHARLCQDRSSRRDWMRALLVDGIALVTQMPDSDAALEEMARLIGQVRASCAGSYFDVRVETEPINLSYTAGPLEFHTDLPAEEVPPGIQFLHCRINDAEGGETLFVDGVAVAETFRYRYPREFRLLTERTLPFYYEHDGFDMRARQRVIELDHAGEVAGVTMSQHMADIFDLSQEELDEFYPAFCRFGRMLQDPRFVMALRPRAGSCMVFDNHRIVHGRRGFRAAIGQRYLRGCYVDRGELRSSYRVMAAPEPNKVSA